MQFVADKFYIWYNRIITTVSVALLVTFAAGMLGINIAPIFGKDTGFYPVAIVLALVQIIYSATYFRSIAKLDAWRGAIYGSMLFMLNVINVIHNTGQLESWFVLIWVGHSLFSGMFGSYGAIGSSFLVTIYYVLIETGPQATGQISPQALGAVIGTYATCALGFMCWKRLFIDNESQKIKQLTGQLQSKQQQAELLIASIADGMIVITPEGQISLMNKAAAELSEWPIDEAVGIDVHLVIKLQHEDGKEIEELRNPFNEVFQKKTSISHTLKLIGRDGTQRFVSLITSPILSGDAVTGAVTVMRDVSEAREEEKRRADFISTASHEMRTPVAAIEGYLALAMNDRVSSIDEKARSYLQKAHSSTQHLGKLFQDLLTSAKAEDGRLVSHPTAVEMGEYLEQLADSLRFSAEKKGLLLDFIIGTAENSGEKTVKPLYYVHVDPDRLREVVTNLFDNAVKYTETGKITLGLTGNNEVVQLYIKDTGPGIPKEDIDHLFQKFYRVDNSATRTIGGTGLGLFICKKIVELYKGRIWVESGVDQGSTFYINLPRLSSQQANDLLTNEQTQQNIASAGAGSAPTNTTQN